MSKPSICLCGPLSYAKESALESKIRELVDYSEGFFQNIYVRPSGSMVLSEPGLHSHVKYVKLSGGIERIIRRSGFIPSVSCGAPFLGRKHKIDLFDISFVYNSTFLTKLSRLRKIPTVVNALGGDIVVREEYGYGFRRSRLNNFIIKSGLNNALHICTLSRFMKKLIEDMGVPDEKIEIIPTGVDTNIFKPGPESNFRTQYGLNNNPVVMYLGSFIPIKGVVNLIKAARLIKDAYPDAKFVFMHFYTDEKYLEQCWNLIDSLELKDDIFYQGSVPHRYISDILAACDVYVHPSFSESLGRSILEAMSCEKPVVVSNAGAMPEYVKNGETGFLATPGVPEEYASSVIRLLDDGALRKNIGRKAREAVEREYSLAVTSSKRLEMYKKLLS